MAGLMNSLKRWFSRQERQSLQADLRDQHFDDMTDRTGDYKDHMMDRIERHDD